MQVPEIARKIDAGREREISTELARRPGLTFQGIAVPMAVFHVPATAPEQRTVTAAGEGANIIGTTLRADQFIDVLRAKIAVRRLGARVLSGLIGNVDIPRLAGSASAGWVADDSALSVSDPDFSKISLTPKTVGCRTEFSRSTLLQSTPDIEQLLRMDFAKVLAGEIDQVAIRGGATDEPDGVLVTSGLATVSMGSTPTWAQVLQIVEEVESANAEGGAWITTPSVVRKLRSTAKVSSTDSVMIMQGRDSLAHYPLVATRNCPGNDDVSPNEAHALIFGDWSDLLIAFWSELDVLVNPYESTAYSKGNVQVRGMATADVAVRHIQSFAASVDRRP